MQFLISNDWLRVTLNHSCFQHFHCNFLAENYTIAWWFYHKRVDLRRQYMQTIIPSLMIQHYVTFCHPNSRKLLNGTNSCVVVIVEYLPKIFMHIYCHGRIVIWINSNIKFKIHKIEALVKCLIAFLRHIKLCHATQASYLSNIIWHGYVKNLGILTIPTYVNTLKMLRCYEISHTLIFHAKNQIGIIPKHLLQYVFMFIS